ncbi:MAG: PorV/PorQ family protein [candidate division KSB1 bacterium]|nr:PorV/PorQ family protein [candidate division KSB1 bacterium]
MGVAQEREKLAQTGLQFLSVASDARAAALADAVTSTENQSSALFFNPAGMANMSTVMDITAARNKWIADIQYYAFSLAIRPAGGNYGVLGLSVQSVDYGEILGTVTAPSDKGYEDIEIGSPVDAFAIGIGYAKAISDRFAVGGQVKLVRQRLGESILSGPDNTTTISRNEVMPLAFDFGTLFKTGFKSLAFGMSVRNFSKEIKYADEGFQLPLVFTMGISMNLMDVVKIGGLNQSALVSVDATHDRSHPEQLKIGIDYKPVNMLSLRGGYVFNNDEDNITFGLGVSQFGFGFDYAYTPFGVFENVQRMTVRFAF